MIRPKRKFWSSWSIPYLGVAAIIAALIPIAIEPILNSQKYSEYKFPLLLSIAGSQRSALNRLLVNDMYFRFFAFAQKIFKRPHERVLSKKKFSQAVSRLVLWSSQKCNKNHQSFLHNHF